MGLECKVPGGFLTTTVDAVAGWARKSSMWMVPFGTACCAIELMGVLCQKYDLGRFGAERLSFSPRQADIMIVGGRVAIKMMPVLQRVWQQMPEPKWCMAVGACCSSGGVFDTYTLVQGIDQFMPVHVYVPGCPPRPENIIDGFMKVQKLAMEDKAKIRMKHKIYTG